jgi:hypothetical protein
MPLYGVSFDFRQLQFHVNVVLRLFQSHTAPSTHRYFYGGTPVSNSTDNAIKAAKRLQPAI